MTNIQLQEILRQYPDDMDIRIMPKGHGSITEWGIKSFEDENILHTSESAYVDADAPEEEWDNESGKVMLGSGTQYLLINPIIM